MRHYSTTITVRWVNICPTVLYAKKTYSPAEMPAMKCPVDTLYTGTVSKKWPNLIHVVPSVKKLQKVMNKWPPHGTLWPWLSHFSLSLPKWPRWFPSFAQTVRFDKRIAVGTFSVCSVNTVLVSIQSSLRRSYLGSKQPNSLPSGHGQGVNTLILHTKRHREMRNSSAIIQQYRETYYR